FGKVSEDIWSTEGAGLSNRGDRRGDGQRRSGSPTQDSTQLPPLHQPLDNSGSAIEERAVGPEWQFERAVGRENLRPVKTEQRFVQQSIVRVTIVNGAIGVVFPDSTAPRVRCRIREAMR